MKIITSKENALVKKICKLKERKYRNEYGMYIVEGAKLVKEAINENVKINQIIINEEAISGNLIKKILKEELQTIEYIQVTDSIFKIISDVEKPQGIMAIVEKKSNENEIDYNQDIILALDDIQDPGNLGTIIRTADSVGLMQILVSKGTVDAYNTKVIRSSMGAIFRVKIIECDDLANILKQVKSNDFQIMVTSLDAQKSIYDTELKRKTIVIGNEANGVSKEILDLAEEKAIIPMLGKTESLNASVATAVILYEYVRKKIKQ